MNEVSSFIGARCREVHCCEPSAICSLHLVWLVGCWEAECAWHTIRCNIAQLLFLKYLVSYDVFTLSVNSFINSLVSFHDDLHYGKIVRKRCIFPYYIWPWIHIWAPDQCVIFGPWEPCSFTCQIQQENVKSLPSESPSVKQILPWACIQ